MLIKTDPLGATTDTYIFINWRESLFRIGEIFLLNLEQTLRNWIQYLQSSSRKISAGETDPSDRHGYNTRRMYRRSLAKNIIY